MDLHDRLSQLGLSLPPAPKPVASYVPARIIGSLLQVSGQVPMRDGAMVAAGRVESDVSVEAAQQAARQCVLNGLAAADAALGGDWSRFASVARVGVFVASDPGFDRQHLVANGASDLLVEVFGEAGRHVRAAVGAAALPLNAAVEVEMTLALHA